MYKDNFDFKNGLWVKGSSAGDEVMINKSVEVRKVI